MINYNFVLELTAERTKYTDAVFTSGDVRGYRLNFSFKNNGKAVDLNGLTLTVKAKRADGIVITDLGAADGPAAYYDVKNSMISVPGELSLEIALADDSGMYVTAKELICAVREGYGEAELTASDKAPVLSAILSSAAAAQNIAYEAKTVSTEARNTANEAKEAADEAKSTAEAAVKADGTNAEGTWSINISGTAEKAKNADWAASATGDDFNNSISDYVYDITLEDTTMTLKAGNGWEKKTMEVATPDYVDGKVGSIETALDNIIAIQNTLIGGESV